MDNVDIIYQGDPDDALVHQCTPFCPDCGERLRAKTVLVLYGCQIGDDGIDTSTADTTDTIYGHEDEVSCAVCDREVSMFWCFNEQDDCLSRRQVRGEYSDD